MDTKKILLQVQKPILGGENVWIQKKVLDFDISFL
jgi:hypothetical protein